MKILLTGATGCLGRNILEQLIEDGHEVLVVARPTSDIAEISRYAVKILRIDLYHFSNLVEKIPDDMDAVIHVAANTSYQYYERETQYRDNVEVTYNLVNFCESLNRKIRFVYTSTISVKDEVNFSNYARTKSIAEKIILSSRLDCVILRPSVIIGKYDRRNYYKMFKILKEGKYKVGISKLIDFCNVEQIAKAHITAATTERPLKKIYFLGGTFSDWFEVSKIIAKHLGSKAPEKVISNFLLKLLACYGRVKNLFNKPADVTFDLLHLQNNNDIIPISEKEKTRKDLDYDDNVDLDKLISSYITWAKSQNLL